MSWFKMIHNYYNIATEDSWLVSNDVGLIGESIEADSFLKNKEAVENNYVDLNHSHANSIYCLS